MTFGVVAFTIIVQGLTVEPALRLLGIASSTSVAHPTEGPIEPAGS